jgi:hypothetical protein
VENSWRVVLGPKNFMSLIQMCSPIFCTSKTILGRDHNSYLGRGPRRGSALCSLVGCYLRFLANLKPSLRNLPGSKLHHMKRKGKKPSFSKYPNQKKSYINNNTNLVATSQFLYLYLGFSPPKQKSGSKRMRNGKETTVSVFRGGNNQMKNLA